MQETWLFWWIVLLFNNMYLMPTHYVLEVFFFFFLHILGDKYQDSIYQMNKLNL